jgi:hypothetical protein
MLQKEQLKEIQELKLLLIDIQTTHSSRKGLTRWCWLSSSTLLIKQLS